MGENQKKILQMLAEGKISVEEASRLLSLVSEEASPGVGGVDAVKRTKPTPKFLYVRVEPKEGHYNQTQPEGKHSLAKHGRVNIRVPVGLIRAGMKLKALIPPKVAEDVNEALKEKGIGFDIRNLKDEYIEELMTALSETEINVDSEDGEVRIHAE